jgi:hypothetical protein
MRRGRTPQEVCEEAIKPVIRKNGEAKEGIECCVACFEQRWKARRLLTVNEFWYTISTPD